MKLNIVKAPHLAVFIFASKKKPQYNKTFTFNTSHINFNAALTVADEYVAVIRNGDKITKEDFESIESLHDVIRTLSTWTNGKLTVTGNAVQYEGQEICEELQEYLLEIFTTKGASGAAELDSWTNFIAAINRSGSYKVLNRLFMFLKQNDIHITADGQVVCWKVVRSDFKDKHSGKFDNSPGNTVEIPRTKVDDNDNSYCSNGLHLCSWNYLKSFSNTGDKVLACLLDPADIVSIPLDYSGEKLRCFRYKVLECVGTWGVDVDANKLPVVDFETFASN